MTKIKSMKHFQISYFINGSYKPLFIKSPSGLFHWGMNDFQNNGVFNFCIPFLQDGNYEIENFKILFQQLDTKIKDYAFENSEQFFGSKKRREATDEFYSPTLKLIAKRDGNGILEKVSFKIQKKSDRYEMALYEHETRKKLYPNEKNPFDTPTEYLPKDSTTLQFIFALKQFG